MQSTYCEKLGIACYVIQRSSLLHGPKLRRSMEINPFKLLCSSFFWKTLSSNHDDKIGILLRGSGDLTSRVRSKALYVLTFLATLLTESHDPLSTDIPTVGSDFAFPWACKQRAFSCLPRVARRRTAFPMVLLLQMSCLP